MEPKGRRSKELLRSGKSVSQLWRYDGKRRRDPSGDRLPKTELAKNVMDSSEEGGAGKRGLLRDRKKDEKSRLGGCNEQTRRKKPITD